MEQLRKEIRKEKDPEQKAKLERALNIMEQRKQADQRYLPPRLVLRTICIFRLL